MRSRSVRFWVLSVSTLALLIFIILRWGEIKQMARAIEGIDWRWLPVAVACEAIYQTNEAAIYWVMFRIAGYRTRLAYVIKLALATTFANKIAPSAGVSGTTLFVERMAQQGVPPAVTVSVSVARYILDYCAFVVVLGIGLIYLTGHHQLTAVQAKASATFGILLIVITTAAVVMICYRRMLIKFLEYTLRILNSIGQRIVKRDLILHDKAAHLTDEAISALTVLGTARSKTVGLVLMGFLIHTLEILALHFVFVAVGYPIHPGVLISGYGLAYLAGFISLIPSGLGVFEASMTAVYASLGVPLEKAVLVTLIFRLSSLWLPFLAGYLCLHLVLSEDESTA